MKSLMEDAGLSSGESGAPSMKKPDGTQKGLAGRLRKALESGDDARVFLVLKGVVSDCMMENEEEYEE
jgi:hypothetical protein